MVRFSFPRLVQFWTMLQASASDYKGGNLTEAVNWLERTDRGDNKDAYFYLLRRCIKEKALQEGRRLQVLIHRRRYDFDGFMGNLLIKLFGVCNSLEEARCTYETLPVSSSMIALNNMLEAYLLNGKLEEARELFDGSEKKDVKAWNTILSAYTQKRLMDEAKSLFKQAKKPAPELWITMIKGYADAGKLDLTYMMYKSAPGHESVWGAMVAAYANHGDIKDAKKMLYRMKNPSVATCTPVFDAFVAAGKVQDAQDVFNKMANCYEAPWTKLLMTYFDHGMVSEAKRVFKLMPNRDPVAWNAMIKAHSMIGELEEARILFEGMGKDRNLESWNAIMAAYNRNGQAGDTYKIFKGMIQRYMKPNKESFMIVMDSCANLEDANKVAKEFRWSSFIRDLELKHLLLKTYLRLGALEEAISIFHSIEVEEKSLESWNLMAFGFAQKHKYHPAANLFSKMVAGGVMPDNASFTIMISASRNVGLLDEAVKFFRWMVADFDVNPLVEDYLCFMQLLKPNEAEELLNSMPFEPDNAAYTVFLEVCKQAGDKELIRVAERALRRKFPLEQS